MNDDVNKTLKAEEHKRARQTAIGGIFLIGMGGVALLAVSGFTIGGRSPWILFGLLPVVWIMYAAYQRYEANGRRVSRQVINMLIWGLFPFAFVVASILGLQASLIWPVAIILTGLGLLIARPEK